MAIQHMTYLDLTSEQRRDAATKARQRVQAMMTNPFLHPDQLAFLRAQLARIGHWEMGTLPEGSQKVALPPGPQEESEEVDIFVDDPALNF